VPYVFKDGDTILAKEINENFSHLDSKVSTGSGKVEGGSGDGGSKENYTYSQKSLSVGRDVLTVLNSPYDIVQLDTLSFEDHDLFTLKFPVTNGYIGLQNRKPLDITMLSLPTISERRIDSATKYNHNISGYPASVTAFVSQGHTADTANYSSLKEEEFDSMVWEKHEFYWIGDDDMYMTISGPNPNPSNTSDNAQTFSIACGTPFGRAKLTQPRGDYINGFSWNATTNVAYKASGYGDDEQVLSDIDVVGGLSTIISECIANGRAELQSSWRKNRYNTYMGIYVMAQILLDDSTTTSFVYYLNSSEYEADLRKACAYNETDCGAEFLPGQRNFSGLVDQRGTLAQKPRREEYVRELFTLFDHIVITESTDN